MIPYSPAYSLIVRVRYPEVCQKEGRGKLAQIVATVAEEDGFLETIETVDSEENDPSANGMVVRDLVLRAANTDETQRIAKRIGEIDQVEVLSVVDRTFQLHERGKIEVVTKSPIDTRDALSMAYTPGVARVCQAIDKDYEKSFDLTIRANTVAVISDGSAVLGLGNIGAAAAMPVMEGKAALFKEFAGVDAFPICIDTQDPDAIVEACRQLAPTFGGINLEDISSPRCVEIEQRVIEAVDIPVFHDDQHGTAVVVLAALLNALKLVDKSFSDIRVTFSGAGAAGVAITKLLQKMGVQQIVLCDREGAIHRGRTFGDNPVKQWMVENTNPDQISGSLSDSLRGADVFIGVSGPDVVTVDDIRGMAADPIVFALSNPDPEIHPKLALPHVRVMATGRSDFPNQINNVLCFPGLFRGLLDARARRVTDEMKVAAARAIAEVISEDELRPDFIIPSVFDKRVAKHVAKAVAELA
ncbi:MAG: NAD-dependent malic enzyme [Planctomycetia bacterium]|jgi:malate dehydrogenase (oxaloacetate-decarboxylating)